MRSLHFYFLCSLALLMRTRQRAGSATSGSNYITLQHFKTPQERRTASIERPSYLPRNSPFMYRHSFIAGHLRIPPWLRDLSLHQQTFISLSKNNSPCPAVRTFPILLIRHRIVQRMAPHVPPRNDLNRLSFLSPELQ